MSPHPEGAVLHCKDLTVLFPSRYGANVTVRAVDGISLEVAPSTCVGVVGESGSGKSTLARALVGLQRPTSGIVCCGDLNIGAIRRWQRKELGRRVAMIFQDPRSSLNPRLSVETVIADPLVVHGRGTSASRSRAVLRLLDSVGLPKSVAGRRVRSLSGGQLQRVAIARALCLEPEFVVADEPTSALDVSVQAQILNLLKELRVEHGFGMLMISHDMRVMRAITDRLVVMLGGRIVEQGPTAMVFRDPHDNYTRELIAATPLLTAR